MEPQTHPSPQRPQALPGLILRDTKSSKAPWEERNSHVASELPFILPLVTLKSAAVTVHLVAALSVLPDGEAVTPPCRHSPTDQTLTFESTEQHPRAKE